MSDRSQPGPFDGGTSPAAAAANFALRADAMLNAVHPDADQLGAFTERALPAHEAEAMLLHLATCARCREIVALAMPPLEAAPLAAAGAVAVDEAPRRHPFAGWRLWLPTGALAATALLVLGLHLHSGANRTRPAETATIDQPGPNLASPPVPDPVAGTSLKPVLTSPVQTVPPTAVPARPAVPPPVVVTPSIASRPALPSPALDGASNSAGTGASSSIEHLPLNGRNYTPLAEPRRFPDAQASGRSTAPGQLNQSAGARVNLAPGGAAPPPPPSRFLAPTGGLEAQAAVQQAAWQQAAGQPMESQQNAAQQNVAQQGLPQQPAAAPKPASPASPGSASETVEVASDMAAIGTENATFAAALSLKPVALPSRRAIASTAVSASRTLAVDAGGTLFLSLDQGERWRIVKKPWKGGAAKVSTAPAVLTAPNGTNGTDGTNEAAHPAAQAESKKARAAAKTSAHGSDPAFELITASGEHWSSRDGVTWQRTGAAAK